MKYLHLPLSVMFFNSNETKDMKELEKNKKNRKKQRIFRVQKITYFAQKINLGRKS